MNILIIDDSQSIRNLLAHFLKGEGYEGLYLSSSAQEGIEMIENYDIDLVLMDVLMPI